MERKGIAGFHQFLLSEPILTIAAAAFILAALSLLSAQNYLLFHSITEIVTIAIAFSIFILVWNNRGIITDTFFLIIGISFLFTGSIDILHTLAYKGMGVFPGSTSDLPTQLWIAARWFQSIAFLIATLFIGKSITRNRRYDTAIILAACTTACGLLLASIFIWQDFPASFIEDTGLTPFKIVSEYIISFILAATVVVLYIRRRSFDPEVWRFLVAAQVFLILGELAFTTYASVYGFTNMLGHLFKLISFCLFYRAIVVVGITRPYDLLFRDLVENINDVIFTMDRKGRIVYISPVVSRMFGHAPEAVTGQDFIRFVHQDDRSRFDEWFKKSKEGERGENEFRISAQDGRERYVRMSVCPLVRAGTTGMFTCTLTDITGRKRAEDELLRKNEELHEAYEEITATEEELRKNYEELRERQDVIRESEEKYRSLVEHNPYGVLLTRPSGVILSANATACRLLGRTEDEIKKNGRSGIVDTSDPRVAAAVAEREKRGTAIAKEMTFIRGDGSRFEGEVSSTIFLDRNGQPMSSMIFSDISERKRTQEALQESEARFRTIFTHAAEGILIADIGTQKFLYANPAICTMLGYSAQELTSMGMRDIHPEKDLARVQEEFMAQARGEKTLAENIPVQRKNGAVLYMDIRTTPVIIDGHRCNIGMFTDITGRKRMENALQLARNKINLLNTVTFQDIQTAAFSVSAYYELLITLVTDEKVRSYLDKQISLNRKIIDILNFAKNYQDMGTRPPQWQDVHQVFLLAISHLDFLHITRHIHTDGLEVYADPLLENVFFHMMQNVLRYGIHATEVRIRYEEKPDGLILFVEDNGVGIPSEEKPMIFDRGHGKNTGLGLFLVREVLSISGMTIKETGEPGKGARFEIMVPKDGYRFTKGHP